MKLPIPKDWDGSTWRCVKLEFPDSTEWLALLNGMLSQWRRGRLWDENTGTVLDAAGVGDEIWQRNNALLTCGDCPDCPDCPDETVCPTCGPSSACGGGCGGGVDIDWEDDMPCLNIADLIKIEDGKLYAKNDCCEWEELGSLERQTEPIPDDPLNPDHDPSVTYSACGKAYAGAEILFSVAENFWDESDNLPWQWISHVENGVGLDLDNKWIIAGVNQAIIMQGVGFVKSLIVNESDKAWVRCQLYQLFDSGPEGATEEQFNDIRTAIKSHAGFNPFVMNFWDYVFFALGWKDFRDVTALNSTDITRNCTCGGNIDNPTAAWEGVTWSHFWDFQAVDGGFIPNALTEWVSGQGWVDWSDTSTRYCKTGISKNMEVETGIITHMWVKIHVGGGFDYSGDNFKLSTGLGNLWGPIPAGGDPVTVGGDFVFESTVLNLQLTSAANKLDIIGEGHTAIPAGDPIEPDSLRIIAFGVGGTGADPWPSG